VVFIEDKQRFTASLGMHTCKQVLVVGLLTATIILEATEALVDNRSVINHSSQYHVGVLLAVLPPANINTY